MRFTLPRVHFLCVTDKGEKSILAGKFINMVFKPDAEKRKVLLRRYAFLHLWCAFLALIYFVPLMSYERETRGNGWTEIVVLTFMLGILLRLRYRFLKIKGQIDSEFEVDGEWVQLVYLGKAKVRFHLNSVVGIKRINVPFFHRYFVRINETSFNLYESLKNRDELVRILNTYRPEERL